MKFPLLAVYLAAVSASTIYAHLFRAFAQPKNQGEMLRCNVHFFAGRLIKTYDYLGSSMSCC